jgi:hypothetical protein
VAGTRLAERRAVAYVEGGACRLVSRNRNAFWTFEPLAVHWPGSFRRVRHLCLVEARLIRAL